MRESYVEGVAIRSGPESCAGVHEGVGDALAGVCVGWVIEPRNLEVWGADAVEGSGRQHRRGRYRESSLGPARSKVLCMHRISVRENREVPFSPVSGQRNGCGAHWSCCERAVQGRLRPGA